MILVRILCPKDVLLANELAISQDVKAAMIIYGVPVMGDKMLTGVSRGTLRIKRPSDGVMTYTWARPNENPDADDMRYVRQEKTPRSLIDRPWQVQVFNSDKEDDEL